MSSASAHWRDCGALAPPPHVCLSVCNIRECSVRFQMCATVCVRACVCAVWLGKHSYIRDQHKTAIGAACSYWPQISLNLIHTRRQEERWWWGGVHTFSHRHARTHTHTQTHAHPSRGQPPITLLCQLPQLSMINPFSMGGQQDCTDKG